MERLTCNKLKTICNGYFVNFASKEEATKYRMLAESAPKYEEIYRKLAEYEELEEQGLLIKLPCKVGDTVWVIDEDNEYPGKKKIYEAKWERVTLVQVFTNHSFELRGEVSYQVYDFFYNDGRTMSHSMYVGQHNTKVGEIVFLTKEEAKQALAKIKTGEKQ